MTSYQTLKITSIIAVTLLALGGCQPKEGPAERAGKSVDHAVDKAGQQVEKAGEKIQDVAKGEKKP